VNFDTFYNIALFSMLVVTAIAVVRIRSLFAIAMFSGVFSLRCCLLRLTLLTWRSPKLL
jgi:hypothetical protein